MNEPKIRISNNFYSNRYYISNSITTSQRLYKESFSSSEIFDYDRIPTNVPTGCAKFRWELANQLDWMLTEKFTNLIHSTYHMDGGHFAAMQLPKIMYQDIIEFVKKVGVKNN